MHLIKRLLAVGGASALLVGGGIASPVFAASSFSAIIDMQCANPGDTQTITVTSGSAVLIHIEVTIGGSSVNGGTQKGTGVTTSGGVFTDQWILGPVSASTTATVRIWAFTANGVGTGSHTFTIQPTSQPCQSPNTVSFSGDLIDVTQVGGTVAKTCDAGVTGTAVFSATLHVSVSYSSALNTTVSLPAGLTLSLACNGAAKALPVLPPTSTITLHESTPPAGAAAAADTVITVGTTAKLTTIHNTKAAVASPTPSPTPRPTPTPAVVLPQTGTPPSRSTVPWLAIGLIGLLAAAGGSLVLRRRS